MGGEFYLSFDGHPNDNIDMVNVCQVAMEWNVPKGLSFIASHVCKKYGIPLIGVPEKLKIEISNYASPIYHTLRRDKWNSMIDNLNKANGKEIDGFTFDDLKYCLYFEKKNRKMGLPRIPNFRCRRLGIK
jgi:hypothetical protein